MAFILTLNVVVFSETSHASSLQRSLLSKAVDARSNKKLLANESQYTGIILVGYLKGCPILKKYQTTLRNLHRDYPKDLLIVNLDPSVSAATNAPESIRDLDDSHNTFPLVIDESGQVAAATGLTTASEIVILDTRDFDIVYRGAIDDRVSYDFVKPRAKLTHAKNVLESLKSRVKPKFYSTPAVGCALNIGKPRNFK